MGPVDLVATQISEMEQRREDAWAVLKKMHDQANGLIADEFKLTAAGGWCAPSSVFYGPAWQPGTYVPTGIMAYPGYVHSANLDGTVSYVRDITP